VAVATAVGGVAGVAIVSRDAGGSGASSIGEAVGDIIAAGLAMALAAALLGLVGVVAGNLLTAFLIGSSLRKIEPSLTGRQRLGLMVGWTVVGIGTSLLLLVVLPALSANLGLT
jgi:hypothetical protein